MYQKVAKRIPTALSSILLDDQKMSSRLYGLSRRSLLRVDSNIRVRHPIAVCVPSPEHCCFLGEETSEAMIPVGSSLVASPDLHSDGVEEQHYSPPMNPNLSGGLRCSHAFPAPLIQPRSHHHHRLVGTTRLMEGALRPFSLPRQFLDLTSSGHPLPFHPKRLGGKPRSNRWMALVGKCAKSCLRSCLRTR